ncbi:hypothetical protein [Lacticaseibacillus paracasei]|uniref:hypothetical protein n=1 Tax=Lacticaseibacillus paracasei TaxID=1597 RepID=UPI0026DF3576|nr:hypothetical protein [Lacticaseibacillus paracasei]MDO5967881.1 hypothetical protein [Lacticaseibacillus paracasei]
MNPDAGKFYGISTACRMMGVSRAAYYKWTHRKVTVHEQENQAIWDDIIELKGRITTPQFTIQVQHPDD